MAKGILTTTKRPGTSNNNNYKGKNFNKKSGYNKGNALGPKADIKKDNGCWFCHEGGHRKNDCVQYKTWLEKKNLKGNFQIFYLF